MNVVWVDSMLCPCSIPDSHDCRAGPHTLGPKGNYFVLGGGLRGGQVLGEYPSRLDAQFNPLDVRDGRMIPTTPWEVIRFGSCTS